MKEKMQKDEDMYTTDVIMITALTTVFADSTCSKKAKEYRVEALQEAGSFLSKRGFSQRARSSDRTEKIRYGFIYHNKIGSRKAVKSTTAAL